MAQQDVRTARVLQFFGIALNLAILFAIGLWPLAVVVGVVAVPAAIAACFN